MEFLEKLTNFSNRIERLKDNIQTEEATKTSIILPFFQLLGYDVFNPLEFVPEFTADVGIKKGEKVDYAIMFNNEPLILIEAKPINTELTAKHMNQLIRYFSVTKAKFGILTNGIIYQFYSDLEEHKIEKNVAEELKQFQKDAFNVKTILSSASNLKYMTMVKNVIAEQFQSPSDQLVKALLSKNIYNGTKTQAVIDKFKVIIQKAFEEYINDVISERLSTVISPEPVTSVSSNEKIEPMLTIDEIEVLDYIKSLLNTSLDITYKKTSRYAYMQIGELSTKWICRVYIRKEQHLFTLHKFEDTDYECEYYFDEIEQLEMIQELIKDTFEKCCKL